MAGVNRPVMGAIGVKFSIKALLYSTSSRFFFSLPLIPVRVL
jgi:hypothetical protein